MPPRPPLSLASAFARAVALFASASLVGCATKVLDLDPPADAGAQVPSAGHGGAPKMNGADGAAATDARATPPFPRPFCIDEKTDAGVCSTCWDEWGQVMKRSCQPSPCTSYMDGANRCISCVMDDSSMVKACLSCEAMKPADSPCQTCYWSDIPKMPCKRCVDPGGKVEDYCDQAREEIRPK